MKNGRKDENSDVASEGEYDEKRMFELAIKKSIEQAERIKKSESDNRKNDDYKACNFYYFIF